MKVYLLLPALLLSFASAPAFSAAQMLDVAVENTGKTALTCSAAIAHWFSADLGEAAPGAKISFSFGVDVASGNVFQQNSVGDKMAVQRVWCGRKGDDWRTREEIPLERRAGVVPKPVRLQCAADGEKAHCSAQ
ncbi:hypothetical protein NBH19_07505 [Rhizobium sp. S95]|uniref:Uncharacterized protein n=1 Tax=Ciceribacter sichuanensis TaxID=2949647 RepID=A0AAJ1C0U7_9HYPH|nr:MULTISPECIES: hypothetical protein [unclassified Ciceribacter]MCM2395928.1 hypothetical protein [Ciceribacter sp. S95]MCM2404006.1 hypothetical protein [Ciceribacter sp. S153]MCO5959597.1 hypothetical protein [Ciceribacter sp. S101]